MSSQKSLSRWEWLTYVQSGSKSPRILCVTSRVCNPCACHLVHSLSANCASCCYHVAYSRRAERTNRQTNKQTNSSHYSNKLNWPFWRWEYQYQYSTDWFLTSVFSVLWAVLYRLPSDPVNKEINTSITTLGEVIMTYLARYVTTTRTTFKKTSATINTN